MKILIISLFAFITFAQVDSMRVTFAQATDADLYGTIIFADSMVNPPTTARDTILAGTEELEWLPNKTGLWYVGAKSLDDSGNVSIMSNIDTVTIWAASSFTTEATRYFLRTGTLADSQKTNINELVTMLHDSLSIDSLPQKFEWIYLFANQTSQASFINLVNNTFDADTNGGLTFTAWQGWAGNGTTGYITSGFNPSTDTVVSSQNSASLALYCRTDNATQEFQDMGSSEMDPAYQKAEIQLSWSDGNAYWGLFSAGDQRTANTTTQGMFIMSRTASNLTNLYLDGDSIATTDRASVTPLLNEDITIGARSNDAVIDRFSTRQYAIAFMGVGFTTVEARKVYNCFQAYMNGIGTGI